MHILNIPHLANTPWKNGLGVTKNLMADQDNTTPAWRISLATITTDSAYSAFPGWMRSQTIVRGAGLRLIADNWEKELPLGASAEFDGSLPVTVRLYDKEVLALNVMWKPHLVNISVRAGGICKTRGDLPDARPTLYYALRGSFLTPQGDRVPEGDALWTTGNTVHPSIPPDRQIVEISIQARSKSRD